MKKLNLGCGYNKKEGYVNIDCDVLTHPDIVMDLEKDVFPFEESSVDEVCIYHVLEHIGDGYFHLLQELYRVCCHGAILDIKVPHHFHSIFINDPTHKRPITVEGLRLFSKKYNDYCIVNKKADSALGLRFNIDYELVSFDYIHDSFYDSIITKNTAEQNNRLFRETVNSILETYIKLVVVKESN